MKKRGWQIDLGIGLSLRTSRGAALCGFTEAIGDPVPPTRGIPTLLAAPLIVILVTAICGRARPDRKVFGLMSLVFASLRAGIITSLSPIEIELPGCAEYFSVDVPMDSV